MIKIYEKKISRETDFLKNLSGEERKKALSRIEAFYFGKNFWQDFLRNLNYKKNKKWKN